MINSHVLFAAFKYLLSYRGRRSIRGKIFALYKFLCKKIQRLIYPYNLFPESQILSGQRMVKVNLYNIFIDFADNCLVVLAVGPF